MEKNEKGLRVLFVPAKCTNKKTALKQSEEIKKELEPIRPDSTVEIEIFKDFDYESLREGSSEEVEGFDFAITVECTEWACFQTLSLSKIYKKGFGEVFFKKLLKSRTP